MRNHYSKWSSTRHFSDAYYYNPKILGGRVETKIPRDGFILISPGSSEEDRLRLCWTNPERLGRFFVPYTFVEACKMAGKFLKQIFVENGNPMAMHIHSSIANINARTTLSERIAVSRKHSPKWHIYMNTTSALWG